ncbi:rhodanese-like domain-containing protein [Fluviicola chungangensis]|uniref:Rhodanese-like domain-containing protein n=1 Tax=Fluviicola chungangensis TaxID=2597671 RepID=A0A556N6X6_9FLAO|nr:rhodanese-like domain-containing protein [Fluviicola chungangensis]TSJ47779.1 rhodanese-like domain-containing protein [Fluviicola chungangensis]
MINYLKSLFGISPKADFRELMSRGAQTIDVRTPIEFNTGHIKGAVNIPLSLISENALKIKKDRPVITCCASGMRSASAKNILSSTGFKEVYNGGGWIDLQQQLQ